MLNAKSSRATLIHASTGPPETPRHVRQWQIMLALGFFASA
jgi:hypothetical protein